MAAPENGAPAGSVDFYRGERIGKYQVITQLSVGGMAELFLGFTSGPGGFRKYVALKRILPDVRSNEQFERMFLDEARITAAFNHPNIAQVYELGQEDDGLFLAMEFIAGQNLDQVTAACQRRRMPMPLGMSLAVARDVCLALHYAHTFTDPSGRPSPVIHRDVAQKNIMVTYDGVVKLLDFGIAKARGSLERTHVGTVKGTAGYMSPEQVRGEKLDGRSDVFSVGVVLWELVTGERLFAGKSEREEMVNILEARIPSPRHRVGEVPEEVAGVILKALERNPGDRFQSGKDMARALEDATGRLMFDGDRRAALMRELFKTKMAATRALLESADGQKEAPAAEPASEFVDVGGGTALYEEASPRKKTARQEADEDLEAQAISLSTQVTTASHHDSSEAGRWSIGLWVVILGIVVGGGLLAMKVAPALDAEVEPQQVVTGPIDPRLRVFPEPRQTPPTAAADAGTPSSGTAAAAEKKEAAEKEAAPGAQAAQVAQEPAGTEARPSKSRRAPQGQLTLVIYPESQVFLGKRLLGKTPLFNAPLPQGTQLLTIVGPDKKRRALSVPIKAGETARLRFSLTDIPVR